MGQRRPVAAKQTATTPDGAGGKPARPRRGRPMKFGRPSLVVALTLPEEVLDALRTVHPDPGWAIVRLVEPILHEGGRRPPAKTPNPLAELVHLPGGRALIVVDPRIFKGLRGISTIPLADGRAFLALDQGNGLADLEVAIIDRLEMAPAGTSERAHLAQVRDIVRAWRRDSQLVFHTRSIIVVEGAVGVERRPLASLDRVEPTARTDARRRSGRARR